MPTSLDQIDARLSTIEELLKQLVQQPAQHDFGPKRVSDIRTEIAMVRAAGGDLVAHFKEKARRSSGRRSKGNNRQLEGK